MLNDFFFVQVCKFVCYIRGFINDLTVRNGCKFLEISFCLLKFGIKTYVPIYKFVAGVNREFIWEFMFCLRNSFLLLSGKFRCDFCLCLKSIRLVFRKLILRFVDDENDLHHRCVVLNCNILIL